MNAGQSVGSDLVVDIREHVRGAPRVAHFGVVATKCQQPCATRLEGNSTINVVVVKKLVVGSRQIEIGLLASILLLCNM